MLDLSCAQSIPPTVPETTSETAVEPQVTKPRLEQDFLPAAVPSLDAKHTGRSTSVLRVCWSVSGL